jgi:hypothetical protein
VLQWSFGDGLSSNSLPLVANLTDDDGDGEIDLCDIPDVVLITTDGTAHIIDGATGTPHGSFGGVFSPSAAAIADLDQDGTPEIITTVYGPGLTAWTPDGEPLWTAEGDPNASNPFWAHGAIAVHDIDSDGSPEVILNHGIYDSQGALLWSELDEMPHAIQASTAVDLDLDGELELVTSYSAWSFADGFDTPAQAWDLIAAGVPAATEGIPHPADFDGDGDVEVLYTVGTGFVLVEHDGGLPWGTEPLAPRLVDPDCLVGNTPFQHHQRPGTIHDFDDDGLPDIGVSTCSTFAIYSVSDAGMTVIWETSVQDASGASGATAFDFLGDGRPEPIYSDETRGRAWSSSDGSFEVALEVPRESGTWMEYPVVADVDNLGSAEFLVVSESGRPALEVYTEAEDRWIQARRIYNQHTYHGVHVREDASIPASYEPHYLGDNTFRVNTAIDNPPGVCRPAG